MNGFYDNRLDDFISAGDLNGAFKYIDWRKRNFLPSVNGKNCDCLYISPSLLKKSITPTILKYGYSKNIRYGMAFSSYEQIKALIDYNKKQKDETTQLRFVITEIEPYHSDSDITYNEMTDLLVKTKAVLDPLGVALHCYMGRPVYTYWKTLVSLCSEINLHCYLKNYTEESIWNYLTDKKTPVKNRLLQITNACKETSRKIRINLLVSNEPYNPKSGEEFGYKYFQVNDWSTPLSFFIKAFNKYASDDMKKHLIIGDTYIFNTKFAKQIKP